MPTSIVIYLLDASPPCRTVLMTAEILNLQVEIKEVNTLKREQYLPEYLQKNHLHTIPLLEEGDFLLADSHAIITYLVSKYGAEQRANLYPSDLRTRATIDQRLFFETSIFGLFRDLMESILRKNASAPSEEQVSKIEEAYGNVEKYLEVTPFLVGDHVTLADVSCVATISTIDSIVPINEKFTKLHEWFNRLKKAEWYKKGNGPGLVKFDTVVKQIMQKNLSS